jgi:mannose-6-phosphate isomerase-like protein (cupin superfamily)
MTTPTDRAKTILAAAYGIVALCLLALVPVLVHGSPQLLREAPWAVAVLGLLLAAAAAAALLAARRRGLGGRRLEWVGLAVPAIGGLATLTQPTLHDFTNHQLSSTVFLTVPMWLALVTVVVTCAVRVLRPSAAPAALLPVWRSPGGRMAITSVAVVVAALAAGNAFFDAFRPINPLVDAAGSSGQHFTSSPAASAQPPTVRTVARGTVPSLPDGTARVVIARGTLAGGQHLEHSAPPALIYQASGSQQVGIVEIAAGDGAFLPAGKQTHDARGAADWYQAMLTSAGTPLPAGLASAYEGKDLPSLPPGVYQFVMTSTSLGALSRAAHHRSTGIETVFVMTGRVHFESGTGNADLGPGQAALVFGNTPLQVTNMGRDPARFLTVLLVADGDPLERPA